jgi:hypothetical protein
VIDAEGLFRLKTQTDVIEREERHEEILQSLREWVEWQYLNGHSTDEVGEVLLASATNLVTRDCHQMAMEPVVLFALQRLQQMLK